MKQKSLVGTPTLEDFVEELVAQKDFGTVTNEVMGQIKEDLLDRVDSHINVAILNALPSSKLAEFQTLLDKEDFEKIKGFVERHIPNLQEVLTAALQNFALIYLGKK